MNFACKLAKQITFGPLRSLRSLSTIPHNVTTKIHHPTLSLIPVDNSWIYQQHTPLNLPIKPFISIDLPCNMRLPIIEGPSTPIEKIIDDPIDIEITKEAIRLIVIRRRKMKKHKYKKLKKRMRFEDRKKQQRRGFKREKEFHAKLIAQCKEAEAFNAEKYVEEKLAQFKAIQSSNLTIKSNL